MIGQTISHYKILSKLGEGGMGVVYKAEDTKLGRPVALKFLPSNSLSKEAKARFLREARAAAALQHPNICIVYEIDEADGRPFIVMAYLEGRELAMEIEEAPLGVDRLLDLAIQAAQGIEEAHANGVVHRDIKPANIMITTGGRAVVMDFGLALLASAASKLTREGTTIGTSAYMSPEQTTGEPLDRRTDIWSLGMLLYEMTTGQHPFKGHYEQAVLYSILNEAPEPVTALRTGAPQPLEQIVNKCLAKRPGERYQQTSELLADLRALKRLQESGALPQQALPRTKDARPSIAVLPFQNRSRDQEDEYFSDGVTEDIISALGNIEGLRVIPRASAFHFKGKRPSLSEVVGLLKVSHVLEGSVRRAGDRLRITVELIDSAEGEQLWTQRYDRVMEDIFDVQDEILRAVADALKVKLLGDPGTRLAWRGTTDVEAYNLVLKGRHLANQYRRESLEQSLKCFEEAIRLDPKFAAAHAYTAETYSISIAVARGQPDELIPKIRQAATRALALDEEAPEGHLVMAMYLLFCEWNWAASEREFRRAIELNPNDSVARRYLGEFLCWWRPSRVTEAREMLEKAVANDPLFLNGSRCLAIAYLVEGNHEAALATCNAVLSLSPDFHPIYYEIGVTLGTQGRMPEAIAAFEKGLSIGAGDQLLEGWLGMACAFGGREKKALELIETFKGRRENGYAPASSIACIYAALQDFDQAFEWFDKAVEERDMLLSLVTWVKLWKGFEPLVADPRFKKMIQTIGIEL